MSAPLPADRIAAALIAWWSKEAGEPVNQLDAAQESAQQYAAALLPVVERIATERAAEALETYAIEETAPGGALRRRLLARATTLRAASREETGR